MATTSAFERAQAAVLEESEITPESRIIHLDNPSVAVHVLDNRAEANGAVPVVFLHSGGTFGALYVPLMAELDDVQTLAMDRPGFGRSGDFNYRAGTYRQTAVDVLTGVLDELGIEQVDLAGNSNGGFWSVVFALARPERVRRLILLGSLPALPGARAPVPLRLYTVPVVNQLLRGVFLASDEADVIEKYDIFGEGETIQRYPALMEAIVARDGSPGAHDLDISEMKSLLSIRGWRSANQLREAELRELQQPTLVIWGEDDPLGGPDDVREVLEAIPDVRLEPLDAGHVPWLGYPGECGDLIRTFRG